MKKLLSIALIGLLTFNAFAQTNKRGQDRSKMTADQIAELHTKKMVLQLELTADQQQKIFQLNKAQALQRQERRKERTAFGEKRQKRDSNMLFKHKNENLDALIAHQKEIKNVLNESQFETWKNTRNRKIHKHLKHKKMKGHSKNSKRKQEKR